ncbi:MAG: 50S ribosomal protein L19 [Chlamydiales bacterium]|jgi:large subunit ribosomal protein L19|nr:50S ribosomal protein L19 [Chlamydiales bacterium]
MIQDTLIQSMNEDQLKTDLPLFRVGDAVRVHQRIIEGEKERIQVFEGIVIARKGAGISETFTLYRYSSSGMKRVFFLHSPRINKIEVMKEGNVRRAKLYNFLGKSGKAIKVKERIYKTSSKD